MKRGTFATVLFISVTILLVPFSSLLPTHAESTWNIQTVDAKAIINGLSIAIDSQNNPHVVYIDSENGSYYLPNTKYVQSAQYLMYASWNGSNWTIQTVDNWNISNVNPQASIGYCSLALDSKSNPHIVYSVSDGSSNLLKYASWTGINWSIQTIDYGTGGSIGLDSANNPHIAYSGTNGDLKYASWTGSKWKIQTIDVSVTDLEFLALDSKNHPSIIYAPFTTTGSYSVKWANWKPTARSWDWSIKTAFSTADLFSFGNAVVDSHGNPRFTYFDENSSDSGFIYYDSWNGSAWNVQTVAPAAAWSGGSFLALDSHNNPYITYVNFTAGATDYSDVFAITLAKWMGASWDFQTIDANSSVFGWPMPVALGSGGNPHICYLSVRKLPGPGFFDGTVMYATKKESEPIAAAPPTMFVLLVTLPVMAAIAVSLHIYGKKRRH
jgi:hypothetical protein